MQLIIIFDNGKREELRTVRYFVWKNQKLELTMESGNFHIYEDVKEFYNG